MMSLSCDGRDIHNDGFGVLQVLGRGSFLPCKHVQTKSCHCIHRDKPAAACSTLAHANEGNCRWWAPRHGFQDVATSSHNPYSAGPLCRSIRLDTTPARCIIHTALHSYTTAASESLFLLNTNIIVYLLSSFSCLQLNSSPS